MKKLFALVALVLGVVSCQTDPNDLDVVVGGEREVMLNVSLPEATRANSANGFQIADLGSTYDLRYILEVYRVDNEGNILYDNCQRQVKCADAATMSFPVRLAPGYNYQIVAWADIVDNGSDADRIYDTTEGLDAIEILSWNAMDETRDAYTGTKYIADFSSASNLSMELTRPFAKVRVVATDINDITDLGLSPKAAKVSYLQDMYTKYNAVTAEASAAEAKSHEYTYTSFPYTDATGEMTLFADYVFIPESGTAKFSLNVYDDEAAQRLIKENSFSTDIFVERNKITTIKGDVLTEGGNVSVKVENDLGELETINMVDTADDLQEIINNTADGESANITLGGDIDLNDLFGISTLSTRAAEPAYGLIIPAGKSVVLDLKGFTISQSKTQTAAYSMIENLGTLTIKDDSANKTGKISYADNGQGGNYVSNTIHNSGRLTIEGGIVENNSSATVASNGFPHPIDNSGTLVINDGTFTNNANYSSMRIWCTTDDDTIITINGGTFNGSIDFQTPSASANKGTLTINGGTFNADTYTKCAVRLLGFGADVDEMNGYILGGHFNGAIALKKYINGEFNSKVFDITAGTFTTEAKEGTNIALVNDDYAWVETENGLWTVEHKADVAKIGEVGYTSLQKAVVAIQDGETITLVANEVFTENNYYDNGGWKEGLGCVGDKSFTLDLNGYTISQNGALNDYLLYFKNNGSKDNTITIKNGTLDAGTTAYSALCTASANEHKITINIEDINLVGNNSNGAVAKIRGGSELNVNAGTVITGKNNYVGIEAVGNNTVVNIYDDVEIYQNGTDSYVGAIVGASYNATMNIYGGYGKSAKCGIIVMSTGATINVSGGEWIANNDGTFADDNKAVLVSQNNRSEAGWACKSILNVTGGTFKGGYNCYGMGPGVEPDDAQIHINGGNFNSNPANYVVAGYGAVEENGVWKVAKAYDITEGGATIYSAAGMFWFANEVNVNKNAFNGKTVTLANDIDLNNENWAAIGTSEANFCGTFDGCNHTIKNLSIVETEAKEGKAYLGFFGYAKNATIKNVVFENVDINVPCLDIDHSQGHIGAVAGSLEGTSTIENVTVKGDIKVYATQDANGASRVAVVAGGNSYGNVTMKNVHVVANEGSYLIANNNTGALAGQLQGKSVFENCSSNIDVTVNKFFAGGIIGLAAGDQTFTNCHTTGNIAVVAGREGRAHDQYRVGGIAGGWSDGKNNVCTLVNCSYTGEISGKNADGSVATVFDYAGYVGRGYTLNGCQGSTVNIDGVRYVQKYNTADEAGIYDVYDVDGNLIIIDGVVQTPEGDYLISKAAGLTWFSDQMNNKKNTFAGKTITIVNDIDMAGVTYYGGSIASYPSYCFKGIFDGGEKVISNLTITVENDIHGAAALIPTLAGDGTTIKNVILRDVNISSSHYAAGIWGYTTSDNCWITVTNCRVEGGTITGNICNGDNADKVGGIGGIFYTGVVSGCTVKDVTISGYRDTAGIVGWAANANASIKNNSIENVTINVNNTTNYKNYTKRSQYDVNSFVGEGVGTAKLEGNTGEATINWGSIAE